MHFCLASVAGTDWTEPTLDKENSFLHFKHYIYLAVAMTQPQQL